MPAQAKSESSLQWGLKGLNTFLRIPSTIDLAKAKFELNQNQTKTNTCKKNAVVESWEYTTLIFTLHRIEQKSLNLRGTKKMWPNFKRKET